MKLTLSSVNSVVFQLFSCSLCILILLGCTTAGDEKSIKANIKVVFTYISPTLVNESGLLTDDGRSLFSGLEGNEKKCKNAFILNPTLVRSDLRIDTSIGTIIEKSPLTKPNAKRDFKLVQEHLKELTISTRFVEDPVLKIKADSLYINYISTEIGGDSILVFLEESKVNTFTINGKQYKTLRNVDEVRNKILSILCQDSKASFTLLVNPPAFVSAQPNPPVANTTAMGQELNLPKSPIKPISIKRVKSQGNMGDLTIIKGSEGCDICTRYYSATDNLGRVRQVVEKNSTNCCPCGKTIEMRGRTYRMECEGSVNRLALVE